MSLDDELLSGRSGNVGHPHASDELIAKCVGPAVDVAIKRKMNLGDRNTDTPRQMGLALSSSRNYRESSELTLAE
jgi:hypothetical protein